VPSSLHPRGPRIIIIDMEPEISSTFFSCSKNTCTADYEATPELVDKLKKGQMLQIPGGLAPMIPVLLPLADSSRNSFTRANEGPPTDPKVFQEQQRKRRCPLCQGPFAQTGLQAEKRI
jgi:Invasion associated locus B (IalB) protein